jgi:membrane-bound serine protease (ClpP class)
MMLRLGAGALALPLALALAAPARGAVEPARRVRVMTLDGAITPVTAEALISEVDRAEQAGAEALVVELDTPGGLETSMRHMVKRMLAADVPIVVYVTPSGARAASAGVFITMAAHIAAMAPGTNIGAATPVSLQGGMDSTMASKATNDAAAFARSIAAQRGRNAEWAERAVRKAVAASEREALDLGVIDLVAADLRDLLAAIDGDEIQLVTRVVTLHTKNAELERVTPGFRQRLLGVIADPNVAYILLMLGFYGLLFELQNPGAILPGVVGAICLVLAFLALSTLPVNYAGIALILLAFVFFIAEIKVTSHGILAAGGVLALLLGSLILFKGPGEFARVSWPVVIGAALSTTLFFLFIVGKGLQAQRRRVAAGGEALIGARAEVDSTLAPRGRVRVHGELWSAWCETVVEPGEAVEVVAVDGLTLKVRPMSKESRT